MQNDEADRGNGPKRKGTAKAKVFTPPNVIANKVTGGGALTEEMLARAEQALALHARDYPARARIQIDRLSELVEAAVVDESVRRDNMRAIFRCSHDIRGQGATFGYDLITDIGSSLCRFAEGLERYDNKAMDVLRAHVQALRAVIANEIKGDGGRLGQEIATSLGSAVEKYRR